MAHDDDPPEQPKESKEPEAAEPEPEPAAKKPEPEPAAKKPEPEPAAKKPEPLPKAVAIHHEEIDDSALSKAVRRFDDLVGGTERVVLFVILGILIGVNLYRLLLDFAFTKRPLWAIEVSRVAAFAVGLLGAAYATQNRRNFGLDLVSALMSRKVKAVVRVFTNLAAFAAAGLLFYGGRLFQGALDKEQQHYEIIPTRTVGWFFPIAATLIMIHVTCHIVIEIDYLRRGKTAPEPEVVG